MKTKVKSVESFVSTTDLNKISVHLDLSYPFVVYSYGTCVLPVERGKWVSSKSLPFGDYQTKASDVSGIIAFMENDLEHPVFAIDLAKNQVFVLDKVLLETMGNYTGLSYTPVKVILDLSKIIDRHWTEQEDE